MRFLTTQERLEQPENLSGQLIAAHPHLRDGQFARTVILICKHVPGEGALGVVLNRSLSLLLEQVDGNFAYNPMGPVPLYRGGPIQQKQLVLTAWQWTPEHESFKLYFGIDEAKARDLVALHPDLQLRGYLGYATWGAGQLEHEMESGAWVLSHKQEGMLYDIGGDALWKRLLKHEHPDWHISQVSRPEDLDAN